MLIDKTDGYLAAMRELVSGNTQARENLEKGIEYLSTYADGRADAHLFKDTFAKNSFYVRMVGVLNEELWWNGGLMYSGPGLGDTGAQALDGSGPAFTVALVPSPADQHTWTLHT